MKEQEQDGQLRWADVSQMKVIRAGWLRRAAIRRSTLHFVSKRVDGEIVRWVDRLLNLMSQRTTSENPRMGREAAHLPRAAQFVLLLIPKRNREHLIGDLEQEYRIVILPQYGHFGATVWYWNQALLALGFYLWPFIKRLLGLVMIWKVIRR